LGVLIVVGVIWITVKWKDRAALHNKNTQIELLARQVNDYKEKLSGASPDQAATKISELEKEIAAFREHDDKRFRQIVPALTPSQIYEWSAKLSKFKVGALYIRSLEHSSEDVRESLYELFRKAGWPNTTIRNVDPTTVTTISSRGAQGAALVLVELFKSVGATVDHQEFSPIFPEHSAIWITVASES
jgi:hypothetical protein